MSVESSTEGERTGPTISIVVPCLGAAATLARALQSLVDQQYSNLQIIVIDGGSDDGSVEVIKRYERHIDSWASEPDRSQADALNKGFARANGEIHGWLCADDELLPDTLHRVSEFFKANPQVDVVSGGCIRDFGEGGWIETTPNPGFDARLDYVNSIEQPSTFWRAEAHARAGELDLSYRYAFDWDWWRRLKRAGARFGRLEELLSVYHFSADNLTSTGGAKIVEEMYRVMKADGRSSARLAGAYRFLYRNFDLHGFYDADAAEKIPYWRRKLFHLTLRALYLRFGRERINAYNWTFAARQERGLDWH